MECVANLCTDCNRSTDTDGCRDESVPMLLYIPLEPVHQTFMGISPSNKSWRGIVDTIDFLTMSKYV